MFSRKIVERTGHGRKDNINMELKKNGVYVNWINVDLDSRQWLSPVDTSMRLQVP
jgi:hypothetical protein